MKKIISILPLIIFMVSSVSLVAQSKTKFDQTIIKRASVEYNCPAEKITIINNTTYPGGGLFVVKVCDSTVYYECMGTVCQPRCPYQQKAATETGSETDGKYHDIVIKRAEVEFGCSASEIKQIKHADDRGQGYYVLSVCGKQVEYQCMGTVCNLKCK